jgi:hypothetical protein
MSPFFKRVLLTALLAGVLDLLTAYTDYYIRTGRFATKMFQYIAGGALGLQHSLNGGLPVILLGIFFHFFIAFSFTLFFFLVYRKVQLYALNKYLAALLYGAFIWTVMTLLVLPLTPLPAGPIRLAKVVQDILLFGLMIGLPLSLSARKYYSAPQ